MSSSSSSSSQDWNKSQRFCTLGPGSAVGEKGKNGVTWEKYRGAKRAQRYFSLSRLPLPPNAKPGRRLRFLDTGWTRVLPLNMFKSLAKNFSVTADVITLTAVLLAIYTHSLPARSLRNRIWLKLIHFPDFH